MMMMTSPTTLKCRGDAATGLKVWQTACKTVHMCLLSPGHKECLWQQLLHIPATPQQLLWSVPAVSCSASLMPVKDSWSFMNHAKTVPD